MPAGSGSGPGAGAAEADGRVASADAAGSRSTPFAARAGGDAPGASGHASPRIPAPAPVPAPAPPPVPASVPAPARAPRSPRQARSAKGEPHAPRRLPQRHSVRGQILDALRNALVCGELTAGEVYSAPALADRFGVSATPVREAMQQLAREGAVEVVPNRGFRIARRTARDLAELAEIRAMIEVPAMLGLSRALPPERWNELRSLAADTVAAAARGDRAGYAESDRAFHHALLSLTGNRQLALLADDLHRRAQGPLDCGSLVRTADLIADAAEHTALLDALAAQDLTVVEQLVREHLTGARRSS
ncbi:GntR family transcriptional regulator [Streptomyces sp. NPDC047108]|uniref:GntR family transcriptional regulator n=1 Tax=Streptomyces sp. NPDC047108 TaxID=3155025 RepID=UPI0033CF65CA